MTYVFAEFTLDQRLFELRRRGAIVSIEPQVLDVLVYLLVHRDRIVSGAELLEQLWPGEYVTTAALSRCIMEARRAVGDDGTEQRVIKTVHGRGYRFVAPVEEQPPSTHAVSSTSATGTVAPSSPASAGVPTAPNVPSAPTAPNAPTAQQTSAPSARDGAHAEAVRDPSLAASAAGEAARDSSIVASAAGAAIPPIAAIPAGASRETAPLRDARRVPIGVAAAAGLIAVVAAAVALGLWLSRGRDLVDPMRPHDRDAYRLYLQATDRVVAQATCDAGALELTRESLAIDAAYAPGWVLLGWTHYNQVAACGNGGTHYQEAFAAAERANALVDSLPAALLLKSVVLVETGRVEEAYDLLSRVPPAHADQPEIQFGRIYALTYAGHLDEAERRLERLIASHPRYLGESGWTPNVLLHRTRWAQFLAQLPDRPTPIFRFYCGFAELQRGRPSDALRIIEPAFRENPNDVFARLSAALRAILQQQPDEARVVVRQMARQRTEVGAVDGEVTYKQAQLLMLAGDRAGALDELARSVAQGFVCDRCFETDPVFEAIRPLDAYRHIAASAAARSRAFGARFGIKESSRNHDAALKRGTAASG